LDEQAAFPWWVGFAEKLDCFLGNMQGTPEIHFEQASCCLLCCAFNLSNEPLTSVVEYNIEAPNSLLRVVESGDNICSLGNIKGEDMKLRSGISLPKGCYRLWFAQRRNYNVPFRENSFGCGKAKTRGCAGNCL
jgi:hypothetical protein